MIKSVRCSYGRYSKKAITTANKSNFLYGKRLPNNPKSEEKERKVGL